MEYSVKLTATSAPPWLSLDSAIYDMKNMFKYDEIYLYEDGCRDPLNATRRDCSAACRDPFQVWNDPSTLANSMVVPIIAKLFQDGNITDSHPPLMEPFGIPQNNSSPLYMEWPAITGCFDEWCKDPSRDGCHHYNKSFSLNFNHETHENGSVRSGGHFVDLPWPVNICEGINAEINPDIGGIGVFVSYILQLVIIWGFWVAWHTSEHGLRYIDWLAYYVRERRCKKAWAQAKRDQEERKPSSFKKTLAPALLDFHKAQCFFMLAVQIACLIALNDPDYLAATSWQQFWNNVGIIFDLAFGGCLLTLLVLLILRRCGERDSFTLAMSTASIGLAAATWFITWNFNNTASETLQAHIRSDGISECGNIAPTQYCYWDDWFFANWISSKACGVFIVTFAAVLIICMILDQIRILKRHLNVAALNNAALNIATLNKAGSTKRKRITPFQVFRDWLPTSRLLERYETSMKRRRHISWLKTVRLDTGRGLIKGLRVFLLFLIELALMWMLFLLLNDYKKLLLPQNYVVLNLKAWTLGQVLAVTIWLPLLCEWVWRIIARMYHDVRGPGGYDSDTNQRAAADEKTSDDVVTKGHGYERIDTGPETTSDAIIV